VLEPTQLAWLHVPEYHHIHGYLYCMWFNHLFFFLFQSYLVDVCKRGCRFFTIMEFIYNHDNLNMTMKGCTSCKYTTCSPVTIIILRILFYVCYLNGVIVSMFTRSATDWGFGPGWVKPNTMQLWIGTFCICCFEFSVKHAALSSKVEKRFVWIQGTSNMCEWSNMSSCRLKASIIKLQLSLFGQVQYRCHHMTNK